MPSKQDGSRNTPIEVEHVNTKVKAEPNAGTERILSSSGNTDNHVTEQTDNGKGRSEFDARIEENLSRIRRPYDCTTEQEPSLAAYHPSFRTAEQRCNDIYERAAELLQDSDYKGDETKQLLADIENIGGVVYATLSRIGLIGDSGVGKSSLINSLLHNQSLAFEGASGSACTQVVTEYRKPWPTQPLPFRAEVNFYEPAMRDDLLRTHIADYHNYIHSSDEQDEDASQALEARYNAASETFRALFCNRAEFQREGMFDEEVVREFMKATASPNDQTFLSKLSHWTRELLTDYANEECQTICDATTAEELSGMLEVFVKTVAGDEEYTIKPSLWPLVRVISVGMHSNALKSGLTLVDLPGLSDVNHVRKSVTQNYMKECAFIILVASIPRVQTDENTNKRLMSKINKIGCKKTLVCTGADLYISLSKRIDIHQFAPKAEAMQEYKRMTIASDKLDKDIVALDQELRETEDIMKHKSVSDQITALRLRKKAFSTLRTEALANMRNNKVTNAMKDRYKKVTADRAPLIVICVSNQWYALQQQGYGEDDIPCSVEASGIPTLRRETLALPAASRLNILSHHINTRLPGLLSSLDSWSTSSTIKRRAELRCIVEKPLEEFEAEIDHFFLELSTKLRDGIIERTTEKCAQWVQAGKETMEDIIGTYGARSFQAWCMKDGVHETKAKPFASWNAQLLEPVVNDLTQEFARHDATIDRLCNQCSTDLCQLINKISNDIKEVRGLSTIAMEPFIMSLGPAKGQLHHIMTDTSAQLRKDNLKVKLNSTIEDNDSYLMKVMLPMYRAARAESGPKSYQRRCAIFRNGMAKGTLFSTIGSEINQELTLAYTRAKVRVEQGARATFEKILRDFDLRFVVEEIRNPLRDSLRKQMKELVDSAVAEINGPVAMDLARAQTETLG